MILFASEGRNLPDVGVFSSLENLFRQGDNGGAICKQESVDREIPLSLLHDLLVV